MALTWQWKDVAGKALIQQTFGDETRDFVLTLYEGNAYLIFMNEYEENGKDMYSVHSFWVDKAHMNRCLGLEKKNPDSYNMYNTPMNKLLKIKLNKAHCQYIKQIVSALVQAFDELEIEIYNEE